MPLTSSTENQLTPKLIFVFRKLYSLELKVYATNYRKKDIQIQHQPILLSCKYDGLKNK